MLNALKNLDDKDAYSALESREVSFFKFKRPLLILFFLVLLVLVVGVFNLPANQKKNIEVKNDLPNPVRKDNVAEFDYTSDAEYLALNRYERFSQAIKKPVRVNRQKVRDTVAPGKKPLTLGGRGFEFKGRQLQSKAGRFVSFTHRLQKPVPKMEPVPEDYLDLRLTQAKSSKDLIFHPVRQAFGKYDRQKTYLKDEKPEKKNPQVLQDIPETKLLLMEADNSFLILRRSSESLDLLSGNEKINRKKYNRW
jgi:hypothetical protein